MNNNLVLDDKRRVNALGFTVIYAFVCSAIILFTVAFYERDHIYWSYLFSAVLLTLTTSWIIWYAYLHDNKGLSIIVGVVGILMLVLLTYFVLETHKSNITIVIRPI